MALVEHDDTMEALATDTADDPLDVRILPRGAWCSNNFLDAHVLDPLAEELTINRITIAKQEAWSFVMGEGLDHLLSCPQHCRMSGDIEVDDRAAVVSEHDKGEEYSKRRCRYCEEIDGDDVSGMIVEKGPPRLRRRLPMPGSILAHGVLVRRFLRHARLLVTPFPSSCYDSLQQSLEATWGDSRVSLRRSTS